jgi:hypothetical protein
MNLIDSWAALKKLNSVQSDLENPGGLDKVAYGPSHHDKMTMGHPRPRTKFTRA